MARIQILLKKDGTIIAEALDFTGAVCDPTLRALLDKLGTVTSAVPKPEYYVQEETQTLEGHA